MSASASWRATRSCDVVDVVRVDDTCGVAAADDRHAILVAGALLEMPLDQRRQELVAHEGRVEPNDGVAEHRREHGDVLAHVLRHRRHRRDDGVFGVAQQIGQANGLVWRIPIPVGQLLGEPRLQFAEIGGPLRGDKRPGRAIPRLRRNCGPSRSTSRTSRTRVGVVAAARHASARSAYPVQSSVSERVAVNLQAAERAEQLHVEILRDLRGRLLQCPLATFTLGIADLANPPVLQQRHHRQQQQRAAGNQVQRQGTAASGSHRSGV